MSATGDFDPNATTPVELTRLVKDGGPLTKRLHLAADGALINDSSQCRMAHGAIERVRLADWRAFGPLIEATPHNAALALGRLRDGVLDNSRLVTKNDPRANEPGFICRTAENFTYPPRQPAFILHDYDTKGMPDAVRMRIEGANGFIGALSAVCPEFAHAGHIRRRSTSAGVVNSETGAEYPSFGEHVFLLAEDGSDARRYLYALHDRAWLAGFGWHIVGKAGQLLERSVVDRMVCAPERLVFEAAPDLGGQPLRQEPRLASVHDGLPLDTQNACPDLTPHERNELNRLKATAADALKPEAAKARTAFTVKQAAVLMERGMPRDRALATAEAWSKGVLRPGATLDFDDTAIGRKTVADVLADPARFDGETLADPIEGVDYGRATAIVLQRYGDGGLEIKSFAHGGAYYALKHDAASVETSVLAAPEDDGARILARLIVSSDLGVDERKRLARLAGTRSKVGSRAAEKMMAEAIAAHEEAKAEERRKRSERESTKSRLASPATDAEAQPIMRQWNDILANVSGPSPPMRDVEAWPVTVEARAVVGLHELSSGGGDDDGGNAKTRLPAPKTPLLTKHNVQSLEIELSDHMTFVVKTKGGERAVAPHVRFLTHWLKYKRSRLPTLRTVTTAALVLTTKEK
jgi:hypothetical protein